MEIKNFNAQTVPPKQIDGAKHPIGMFPFQITNTYGKENKTKDGGMLVVEFTSPVGSILKHYNLFNKNDQAREIAHGEVSALCHCTGIFQLSFEGLPMEQWARELRNARGQMKVDLQKKDEPDGYVEVKKVFDINGNEPGKGPAAAPQPQQQGGWGPPPQQQAPQNNAPANNTGGWQQAPAQQRPQPQPTAQQGGWQPGPSNAGGPANPPWVTK